MRRKAAIAILVAGLVAAGCGDEDGSSNGGAATTGASGSSVPAATQSTGSSGASSAPSASDDERCTEDRIGGSLTFGPLSIGASLDPYDIGGGTSQQALELLAFYDSLLRYDDATGEFIPHLAESITPNADATEWVLVLRDGIEFGNGDPMDAAAVKASIDNELDPDGTSRMKGVGQYLDRVEVVDDLTVKFVLKRPLGSFPLQLSAGGGAVGAMGMIRNMNVVNAVGREEFAKDPTGAGAGPYEIESWNPPNEVILTAKKDWWGGPVCIERITITPAGGAPARIDAMRSGSMDMATVARDPITIADAKDEFAFATTIDQSNQMIEFNQAHPELADVRVRQAVAMAIDPEVVNERAFGGVGLPGNGLVYEGSTLLKGTEGIAYDADAAKSLVEELKGEGMSLSYTLLLGGDAPANVEAGIAIKAMLEAAGFTITLDQPTTQASIGKVYRDRDFELFLGGQIGSEATLFLSLQRYDSRNPAAPFGVAEPEFDAALDNLGAALTPAQLQDAVEAVQDVWNRIIPGVIYASDNPAVFYQDHVKGLLWTRGVTPYFDQAYIER